MKVHKPRYWAGDAWVTEESVTLPDDMKLEELPAFAAEHGIPGGARLRAAIEYEEDGSVVQLVWYTRDATTGE